MTELYEQKLNCLNDFLEKHYLNEKMERNGKSNAELQFADN